MRNDKKQIHQLIRENLSQLYMFVLNLTSSREKTENLLRLLFSDLDSQEMNHNVRFDKRLLLFRKLYQIYLRHGGQKYPEETEATFEHLEEFYLYNRLEEKHLSNQEEKLACISQIQWNDWQHIYANIPLSLRPYFLLRHICNFTYPQISYILQVPQNEIMPKLNLANKIFQSVIWHECLIKGEKIS